MRRLALGLFVILGTTGAGSAANAAAPPSAGETKDPAPAGASEGSATAAPATGAASDVKIDEGAAADAGGAPRKPSWEDIVVVPRKAFLKSGRLELAPFTGISLNDVLIRHFSFGGDLNYYLTDVLSVGLQGQYFIKDQTGRGEIVGLQYNRVPTLNRYMYAGALNFGYVPGYGKFSLFNRYIWHWDIFVSAGVGVIKTEIIPRIPSDAAFQSLNITPDFGIGTRLFLNDWLTVSVSFRDYVFNDKFEPTDRKPTDTIDVVQDNAISQFVNNMMLYASLGIYLPTSFQYRTPR